MQQTLDEEQGPHLVFADGTQSIYLTDMSGDGLVDLARIRNGEVCYWPNLGYGRFGAKVTMDDAPWFDRPDLFDQRRIRLADIDGSGTTDIIYLGRRSHRPLPQPVGQRLERRPQCLHHFPRIDNLAAVSVTDLTGNGTACLVWSSPLPGDRRQPVRYIDLMGGQEAAPDGGVQEQPGRRDPRPLCLVDQVLSGRQGRGQTLDHQAALPGPCGRAGGDP